MSKSVLAIANCRVSSDDQLLNNSLKRQRDSVLQAAKKLGVTIPEDGWWSGSVSSKRGGNLKRRDIQEMLQYCEKHKTVKYLIVDEPDRFMRSVNEALYFEVMFQQLGVTIWYASDDDLNNDNLSAKLMKFMKYFVAEGSNEERQRKSIAGQVTALREGRYPFSPKPGYKKGRKTGVQEIHPMRGPILRDILVRLAARLITPTQALIELNASDFMKGRSPYKMDKFRIIATDPFYAGIVEINKQVQVRNENGLHNPIITKEQHYELIRVMEGKKKNQPGPRKNGNPKFPLSNLVSHTSCSHSTINRYVGLVLDNGKNKAKKYEKYRCRACQQYLTRQELHEKVERHLNKMRVSKESRNDLLDALNKVWKLKEGQAEQEATRLSRQINDLQKRISNQAEAAIDPENIAIKEELMASIAKKKEEVSILEDRLSQVGVAADHDKDQFLQFAFDFIDNVGTHFLDPALSHENRLRCKQLVFPAGFYMDENGKVYTPEISPLYRLAAKKKDAEASDNSLLVRVTGL